MPKKKTKTVVVVKNVGKKMPKTKKQNQPIKGKGAYNILGQSTKGWLGNIGSGLGSLFGDTGSSWGRKAGDWLGGITGMGAYKINQNSLMNVGNKQIPSFGSNDAVINHREYVGDVITGAANTFNINPYSLNAGLQQTFPWLSQIAPNYEFYDLLGCVIEYKTTSSDALNSTNTALGSVIIATNYDVSDGAFTTKQQMDAYEFVTSCKPSESMLHPVECARAENLTRNLLCRSSGVPAGYDKHFFDKGTVYVATTGMQAANVNIGELWISYHVRFSKPKLQTPLLQSLQYGHFQISSSNNDLSDSYPVPSANHIWTQAAGSGFAFDSTPVVGSLWCKDSTQTYRFNLYIPGRWLYIVYRTAGTTTTTGGSYSVAQRMALTPAFMSLTSTVNTPVTGSGTDKQQECYLMDCSGFGSASGANSPPNCGTFNLGSVTYVGVHTFEGVLLPVNGGFLTPKRFNDVVNSFEEMDIRFNSIEQRMKAYMEKFYRNSDCSIEPDTDEEYIVPESTPRINSVRRRLH